VAGEFNEHEQALALPYSLALRLRDTGVATEVVCEYVDVEEPALNGIYRITEAKLAAAQQLTTPAPGVPVSKQPAAPARHKDLTVASSEEGLRCEKPILSAAHSRADPCGQCARRSTPPVDGVISTLGVPHPNQRSTKSLIAYTRDAQFGCRVMASRSRSLRG
jgi:hypothetical protein